MEPEDVTFQLLREITDDFSDERKLGEGTFGVVYKGLTKNGEYVAVKKLRRDGINFDHHKQFRNELDNLTKLKHQNIVRLYGYCYQIEQKHMEYNGTKVLAEETHRALCLEYLDNGSLQKHLADEFSGLDWPIRYKIIKGTCEGLKHIHEELEEALYHLDIKPDNILLDKNMVPKLADFGLSRIFGNGELTRTTQSPLGTLGYQPPEFIERGHISKKFDLFSLGIVMIRIISGPEGYDKCANMPSEEFMDLVKLNWRTRLQETWSDSSLETYCHQVETCIQIALYCVEKDSQKRPDIVKTIDKLNQIEIDNRKHPKKRSCKQSVSEMTTHKKMKMRMEPNDITDKKQHFNLMTSSRRDEVEFVDIREKLLGVGEEFIVGRTEEKMKILTSLLQSMPQQIIILPIYGIGGIGKTTFAKLIYNDTNFKYYSRVWVYVSPIFDLNKVHNSIISQLSAKESQINKTCLSELLSGKKTLIVLDDMWEENLLQLKDLKDILNPGDSINTIVLVTTCSERVAENITTNVKPYKIESLTNDMCWDIIKQRSSFDARDDKEHLTDIGIEIAKKCGGVALAAQSLGFMLRPMQYDQWIEVKDSDIWNECISKDATLPNHVLASLKLSYAYMAPCLRSCFTYCAIFPKGHQIIKEDLIHQWISLDFIKPMKLLSSMQLCEKYIVQLRGLSFLQHPVSSKDSRAYQKGLTLFTMHDLVHHLARSLMGDEVLDDSNEGGRSYRYACLTYCKPLKSLTDCPDTIRALHFLSAYKIPEAAFVPANRLQVLSLCESMFLHNLPASIGNLVHLRYLNAPGIQNETLPDSLTKLSGLIYLNLSGSRIIALPDSIGEIEGLMHLDISRCVNMEELPESFANLKKLVHLDLSWCDVKIRAKTFGDLTNIQHLNLGGNIINGSDILERMQDVISNLIELRYLGLSGYTWRANQDPLPDEVFSFLDCICTLSNLVHLDFSRNHHLVSVPESIGKLRKLHTLDLSGCWSLGTLPECILKMDSLKVIDVTDCPPLDKSMLSRRKDLSMLPYFVVHPDDGESISSNIGLLWPVNPNELHISRLDNVMSAEEVHSLSLREKMGMESLKLEWTRDAQRSVEDVEVLGMLLPPRSLNHFELRGYHSVSFPTWVMDITTIYLLHLTSIVLWELRKCNSLPPLGQLPNLQYLAVGRMDSITTIEEGFCGGPKAFLQLSRFHLCQMENLEVWDTTHSSVDVYDVLKSFFNMQKFMFPELKYLVIRDCPKLRLKPCPPKTREWEIENSDNVLSSWDAEGEIDHAALLSPWGNKCKKYGAPDRASTKLLTVKSSNVPLDQWRLCDHIFPIYQLRIKCCSCLTSRSQDIIPVLSRIRALYLELEDHAQPELPKWLGEFTSLARLGITKYPGLEAPVESMKKLTGLRYLWLGDCGSITLPQWLGELIHLRKLVVSDWRNLSHLPESMQRLTSLDKLRLEGCPRITALPEWLGDLTYLNCLSINCTGIESLPESIQKLTKLERLTICDPKLAQWCVQNNKKLAHIKCKNILVFSKYYSRITLKRLADLLCLSLKEVQKHLSDMVNSASLIVKIDRPMGVVSFRTAQDNNGVLNSWATNLEKLLDLVIFSSDFCEISVHTNLECMITCNIEL